MKRGVQRLWSATRGVVCDLSTVSCDRVSRSRDGVVYVCIWAMARSGSNGECLVS